MKIKDKAVREAVLRLTAAGAQFHINHDGKEYGEPIKGGGKASARHWTV